MPSDQGMQVGSGVYDPTSNFFFFLRPRQGGEQRRSGIGELKAFYNLKVMIRHSYDLGSLEAFPYARSAFSCAGSVSTILCYGRYECS